ncbi:MAG: hypothetical protein LBJ37_24540 [Paucimonas sp.]|jgi:hypothetical protein|nr:hypothetical protein [Paucimonas sp.]
MSLVTPSRTKAGEQDALDQVLVKVSKTPLHKVDEGVFACFAKSVWFDTGHAQARVQERLKDPAVPFLRKRRLLYLMDRLRRYPCLDDHDAGVLKQFVQLWEKQLSTIGSWRQTAAHTKDKLAQSWGVDEDASRLFSSVLDFQTRHYTDAHNLKSGYSPL